MITTPRRSYVSTTITLTASTITNLLAAVNVRLAALNQNAVAPDQCCHLRLQSATANAAIVYVGDYAVSATDAGLELAIPAASAPGIPAVYRNPLNVIPVGSFYLFSTGTAQKVNVEIISY